MRRFSREPLIQFLAIGAALFGAHALLDRDAPAPERIVVTRGQIEALASTFARTWQRSPTQAELDGLIEGYVLEEACAREAIALGLDRDDGVIRRRLQQKLEFVYADAAARSDPSDAELAAFLAARPETFRAETTTSFTHVFLSRERDGGDPTAEASRLLARLTPADAASGGPAEGDPFLLDRAFDAISTTEIESMFGERFARAIGTLPIGRWEGPVESSYGIHLVFVRAREEGRPVTLEEFREPVRRAWLEEQRVAAQAKFREAILARYRVEIEEATASP